MIAMLPMRDAIRIHFIPLSPSHSGRAHFFTSGCDNATTTSDLRQKKWSARINKLWRMGWEWSEWHMRMSGSRANNSVASCYPPRNCEKFPEKWTTWMREKRKAATGIPILPRLSEKKLTAKWEFCRPLLYSSAARINYYDFIEIQSSKNRRTRFSISVVSLYNSQSSAPGVGASETIHNLHKLLSTSSFQFHKKVIQFTVCWCFCFPLARITVEREKIS